jgi:hypothetical protein
MRIIFPKLTILRSYCHRGYEEYKVTGRRDELEDLRLKFRIHLMGLTSYDKHKMQFDQKHVPSPIVNDSGWDSSVFHLPLGLYIVYDSNSLKLLVSHLNAYQFPQTPWE